MAEITQLVNALRRPRLLLRAVRHGLGDYRREAVLRRLLGGAQVPGHRKAINGLLPAEEMLEHARQSGDASYSASRHVEVLVALIAEARSLSSEAARAERAAPPRPAPLRAAAR